MSEITKLYENVDPNRNCNLYKHFMECPMKHTQCEDCENFVYPPFTAEKQLKLLKLFVDLGGQWESFEEAIAGTINLMYENGTLTEEEQKQIREILK